MKVTKLKVINNSARTPLSHSSASFVSLDHSAPRTFYLLLNVELYESLCYKNVNTQQGNVLFLQWVHIISKRGKCN